MTSQSPAAIVASSEKDRLSAYLRLRQPFDYAVAAGRVRVTKVAGSWLYHPSTVSGDSLADRAFVAAEQLLGQWLVIPMPVMGNMLGRTMEPSCTSKAA